MSVDRADAMLEVMDERMHEASHEGNYRRIEVITGRRQRRNWTGEEKARLFAESAEADEKPRSIRCVYRQNVDQLADLPQHCFLTRDLSWKASRKMSCTRHLVRRTFHTDVGFFAKLRFERLVHRYRLNKLNMHAQKIYE